MKTNQANRIGEVLSTFKKNGKDWQEVVIPCKRCGGSGEFSYNPHDGTMCLRCEGSGIEIVERRLLSEKEQLQREKAKSRKEARKAAEEETHTARANEKFLKEWGFEEGSVYMVTAPNTYDIKEEIKAQGGRFNKLWGWYFTQPNSNFPVAEITREEALITAQTGRILFNEQIIHALIKEKRGSQGEYQGQVGDKIQITATIKKAISFANRFGSSTLYIMEDSTGNQYKWSTGKFIGVQGDEVKLEGTVKAHEEYNDHKQTVLTRCKEI